MPEKQPAANHKPHQKEQRKQPAEIKTQPDITPIEGLQQALLSPRRFRQQDVIALQRMAGNRAVSGLLQRERIQAKLTVGPADDPYEREADRVAGEVLSMAEPSRSGPPPIQREAAPEEEEIQTKPLAATITPLVQRQELEEEELQTARLQRQEDEEEIQTKRIQRQIEEEEIQTSRLQRQEDEEEIQTDRLQRQEDEEEIQTDRLQRQEDEEEIQTDRSNPQDGFEAGHALEERIQSARNGGSPLPGDVRGFMEPRFGADFSAVRLHTGSESAEINRSISARAFTLGQDIFLGEGQDNLGSDEGRNLLAHELTHVVQQTGARAVQRKVIQRFMSVADWKKHSSVTGSRRSKELKVIDAAVDLYNQVPKDKLSERIQALTRIHEAIDAWQASKGSSSSSRADAIKDLRRDIDVEYLGLVTQMEMEEQKGKEKPVPEVKKPEEKEPEVSDKEMAELEQMAETMTDEEIASLPTGETDPELAELEKELEGMSDEEIAKLTTPEEKAEMDRENLENVRVMILAQKAIIQSIRQQLEMAKKMPPEQVEKLQDEIREAMDKIDEISDALSQPLSTQPGEDESAEKELQEMLKGQAVNEDDELAKLQAEVDLMDLQNEPSTMETMDPEDIQDQLERAEEQLASLEEEAKENVKKQAQVGQIISVLLPLFIEYKAKKAKMGKHGIKSDQAQAIIEQLLSQSRFDDLYSLDTAQGDQAIQQAAEMAFGDTWNVLVKDANLFVLNPEADEKAKEAAAPLKAEIERIAKSNPEQWKQAIELLASAQVSVEKSGERSASKGPASLTVGGTGKASIGAEATAKASAEIDRLSKSINAVLEASAKAGMSANLSGFIKAGLGDNVDLTLSTNLDAFFGASAEVGTSFQASLKKLRAEAHAKAFAGAKVSGSGKAELTVFKNLSASVDAEGEAFAGAKAEAEGVFEVGITGISLKGSAEAFAGVKATGSVGTGASYKGKKLFSVRAKAEAWAGAGAKAEGEFTFKDGKLKISGELGVALGLGTDVGVDIEVDFAEIGEAIIEVMKDSYHAIFPEEIDRRSPSGPRDIGLSEENRGKLFMAAYPAFAAYGKKKADQGEHGIKRQALQDIIDEKVIRSKSLQQEVTRSDGKKEMVSLYKFAEADETLIFAAMTALSGQIRAIDIQAGQIRMLDAVAKESYVGLGK